MKNQTDLPTATANEYSPWIPYILWSTAGGTGCDWLISEEAVAAYEAYLLAEDEQNGVQAEQTGAGSQS